MRNLVVLAALAMFSLSTSVVSAWGQDDEEKPKYTMKVIMMEGMKGGLLKKVASGEASEEETKKMTEMVKAMEKYEVTKGTEEEWKKSVEALSKALKATVAGEEGGADALKKASNCAACHKVHKP